MPACGPLYAQSIEMAWAQVKGHIKENTCVFNLQEVERLVWEGFEVVTQERWADLVKHVRDKVEDQYWAVDGLTVQYADCELTFCIRRRPDDDPNTLDSSELDTTSDSDNDSVAAGAGDEDEF